MTGVPLAGPDGRRADPASMTSTSRPHTADSMATARKKDR